MDLLVQVRRFCACQYWAYDLNDYYVECRLMGLVSSARRILRRAWGMERWWDLRRSEQYLREAVSPSLRTRVQLALDQRERARMVALARLSPAERTACRQGSQIDTTRLAVRAKISVEQFSCILAEYYAFVEKWAAIREHMEQTPRCWWWP